MARLDEATRFVSDHYLGDNIIQFVPADPEKGGIWVMLRVTGDQKNAIINSPHTTLVI
jgi:hypothetical protein